MIGGEKELREVRGGERGGEIGLVEESRGGEGRHGYPDGFRQISGVLERLEILG